MTQQSVLVNLPVELYRRIRGTAQDTNRTVETVLLESLMLLFADLSSDAEPLFPVLDTLSDDQLWAVIQRRLTWPESARLRELVATSSIKTLSMHEQSELDSLLEQVDRYTLLRSKALLLLKQRGHPVEKHLGMVN
ncbi:MAG: hypothetical protein M3Q45_02050 [Chloroflexota bacterium]|nr:hypothetical protein [Chloroflexota bacterium]